MSQRNVVFTEAARRWLLFITPAISSSCTYWILAPMLWQLFNSFTFSNSDVCSPLYYLDSFWAATFQMIIQTLKCLMCVKYVFGKLTLSYDLFNAVACLSLLFWVSRFYYYSKICEWNDLYVKNVSHFFLSVRKFFLQGLLSLIIHQLLFFWRVYI